MKGIKAFTAVLMVCLLAFCSAYTAFAAVYVEDWGFRFEKINNGSAYEINKYIGDKTDVVIPDKYNGFRVVSVGEYAFIDTSITSVTFGNNVTEIKNSAFINVESLETVIFNDSLTTIGNLAFAGCTGLSELTIPASVSEIADDAFANCSSITIDCYTDSAAHVFAENKGIPYVLLDATEPEKYLLGDADADGEILINDATVIQRVLADLPVASFEERNADVNGDELDISDATQIQRYIAELPVNSPIGEWITAE